MDVTTDPKLVELRELAELVYNVSPRVTKRFYATVVALKEEGYRVADLAKVIGVTEQRVYQILDGKGTARVGRGAHRPEEPDDRNGDTAPQP